MNHTNCCEQCGLALEENIQFCPKCGTRVKQTTIKSETSQTKVPRKSAKVALLLCLFLGMLGAHRFYVRKIWTGLMMLFTGGLLGIWVLIDLIMIIKNKFEDKQGKPLILTHNLPLLKESVLIGGTVAIWFSLFIATTAAVMMYSTSALVQVVDFQLAALQDNQFEKAYSLTASEFQHVFSLDDFKKYIAQYPAFKNNYSASFSERKILNNTGYLAGVLTAKDGSQTPIAYRLIKENGQWKIYNFKIFSSPPETNPK